MSCNLSAVTFKVIIFKL